MFIIKQFNDKSLIQHFKANIIADTRELKFDILPKNIGVYSKINNNIINIKYVSEEEDRGGPIFMHFYGIIFNKKYLLGIICPQMLYTLFTFGLWLIKDEYPYFKIIALILWLYIYLSNFGNVNYIRERLIKWMGDDTQDTQDTKDTGDGSVC